MSVLLMRLAAPMQSWGARSRFTRRETEAWPTKSGVIGIIAAALGIGRDESLERFDGLRFGVRVDQPGTVMSDYQTARTDDGDMLPLSRRYYLQDAVFLAGLESTNRAELERYRFALASPYYQLFLGRRSCPPDGPVHAWISDAGLEDALRQAPWQATERYQYRVMHRLTFGKPDFLPIIVEPLPGEGSQLGFVDELMDEPVSFSQQKRLWKPRRYMRLDDGASPRPTVPELGPADGNDTCPSESESVLDDDAFFDAVANAEEEEER